MIAVIAVWSVVAVLLGLHITRISRQRSVPSLADEAERARILATPVEELAEEIVRERERAAPGYLSNATATYMVAIASFAANYGGPGRCLLDACSGPMFSSPTTRRSICGRCGRVVDWEAARQ